MKSILAAPVLALLFAGAALAQSSTAPASVAAPLTLTLQQPLHSSDFAYHDGYGRRTAATVILNDALYGGLIGLAIGTGVALIGNDFNNGGWGRDLAVGAGIGLIAGGIFGAVDVASSADRVMSPVDRSGRDRGFSRAGGLRAAF